MTDPRGYRDAKTGRYARRPVPDVDATSEFDPMGDSIEDIGNISGTPSANMTERPRYAPDGDTLAGPGLDYGSSPLRSRRPELVHPDDAAHTIYGTQGAVLRTAARSAGHMDPTPYLTGLEPAGGPSSGVQDITDNYVADAQDVRGDLRPAQRGLGRGRDR